MNILVLNASGDGFIRQLSILQHLCEIDYIPDLTLASSGGNVSTFIACAADWNWAHIERIARDLKSSYFVSPWSDIGLVSKCIGFFNGNAFNHGEGSHAFLKKYFTKESISKHEIWTGTYNKERQKFRLFCNKSKEDSIINCNDIDYDLTQSMEPSFADGDIDKIATFSIASAGIPGLVSPTLIDGEAYIDGALCGASPLTLMQGSIVNYLKNKHDHLHITYVNSKNLSSANDDDDGNLLQTYLYAVESLLKSSTLIDRLSAYKLFNFNNYNDDVKKRTFPCTHDELLKMKEKRKKVRYSLLEIYPTLNVSIDITNFDGDDIKNALHKIYGTCMCTFWYIK